MRRKAVFALCLLAALLLSGCGRSSGPAAPALREPAGMELDIVEVTRGTLDKVQTYSGLVLPRIRELSFPIGGTIADVLVSVGSRVKKGDVLAKLNTAAADQSLENARERLEYARAEHELNVKRQELQLDVARLELEELRSLGMSSTTRRLKEIQIEDLEAKLEEFQGLWALTEADLVSSVEKLEEQAVAGVLLAPCSGTVVHCIAADGSYAMTNNPLIWIAEEGGYTMNTDYLTADVVSRAVELYAMVDGVRVEVEYEPLDRKTYLAKMASNEPMQSTFKIGDTHGAKVTEGMEVVIFLVTDRAEDALQLPANAVRRDSLGTYVYKDVNGSQQRQSVSQGIVTDALIQITHGLEEGDKVYVGN